ncbi:MAG: ISKra4 family transposase [Gemmataceae bacterium]|nr:ISKra4 family transposase [Gemmataceae bacterium]
MTCPDCQYAAKFHSYQPRRLLTVHGEVRVQRAYYYCGRCRQSFLPYDDALGLVDEISPGLLPLVCLAGVLLPFADAAEDVLKRFAGVRVSPSTVLRRTEGEGERLRAQLKGGRMVQPTQGEPKWTGPREAGQPAAYVGLDAFSVPMQGPGAGRDEHRMLYTALLYTPQKEHTRYLVDFELDTLAEQVRAQATALGLAQVSDLIAVTDGGNGLEEALQRHLAENLTTILDWYHAAEHLGDFAKVWHARDEVARVRWHHQATGLLYERGGEALLTFLQATELPAGTSGEVREEFRRLIGYFENNRHRTDYPRYRQNGWDIGSGPTEAGCKIIGERLKGSGMRWVEEGAATVAALRALYVSGGKVWDGFWSQPYRPAA